MPRPMTIPLTPVSEPEFFARLREPMPEPSPIRWRFLFYGTCRRSAELIQIPILAVGEHEEAQDDATDRARMQLIEPRMVEFTHLKSKA